MNKLRKKNLDLLKKSGVYHESMEHDACGVGLVASTAVSYKHIRAHETSGYLV